MKRKILSLFMAMTIFVPLYGTLSTAVTADNTANIQDISTVPTSSPATSQEIMATEAPAMSLDAEIEALAAAIEVGEKDESYMGDINIYTTYGTLPTLYALLNLYADADEAEKEQREPAKNFVWYLRGNTANPDKLPDGTTIMMPLSKDQIYTADYAKKFMAYTRKLYNQYPNAHFNLFCDDLRAQAEILYFTFNHIPKEQYNVNLLSDGTGSYSFIKNYFYSTSTPDVEPVDAAKDKWDLYKYWYEEFKRRAERGEVDEASFLNNNMGACYIMYAASAQDNIQYYLQWPELMISDDAAINGYLDTMMHRTKQFPTDIYAQLSQKYQDAFMEAVLSASGLTKAEYDNTYLKDIKNGKKYMIISGGSPNAEGSIKFEDRANAVMEYFGNEYTYLYKPHPSWPASAVSGRTEYLQSKGIVELPAQTPMEVILTAYPEVELGGYNSSLYMSATGDKVKFFFAVSPSGLSAPLPDLFNMGMYPQAVFFAEKLLKPELVFANNTVTVNNASLVPNGKAVLIAASYDNGVLNTTKTYDISSSKNSVDLSNDFSIGDAVKLYLWSSLSDMKSIAAAIPAEFAGTSN